MKFSSRSTDDLQRDLGSLAVQITTVQFTGFAVPATWQPAINAFRCDGHFVVCVDLAGVDKNRIQVRAEPSRLVIQGSRDLPEPDCNEAPALQVFALEIDHGRFERVVDLPSPVETDRVTAEHRNGLLWIKLPLRPHA